MATSGSWQTASFGGMDYDLLLPDGYVPGKQYPVLMFLHGGGEETNLIAMMSPWFDTPDFRAAYPAIVVAPILKNSSLSNNWGGYADNYTVAQSQALAIVQQVTTQYNGDPNRVYLTGLSLGGAGSWDLMIKYNAYDGLDGRVFAAALPLAQHESAAPFADVSANGNATPTQAVIDELRNVPIWAVNGAYDSPGFDEAMAAALPNSAYHYTELPLGHDVWDTTYPLPNGKPYYDWLFSQSANIASAPAPAPATPTLSPQLVMEQQVARLYVAAFGRAADSGGLIANYRAVAAGLGLAQLGDSFAASPEFLARYGHPSNADFVAALYQNVLGRPGDAAGIQAWQSALAAGQSRGTVLVGFSESPEEQSRAQATAGTTYAATAEAQVTRLYDTGFGRAPDAGGEAFFATALLGGTTLQQEAATFLASPEFVTRYGAAPSDLAFVDTLYVNTLRRAADPGGESYWVGALQSGQVTRTGLLVAFSESPEHIALLAAAT